MSGIRSLMMGNEDKNVSEEKEVYIYAEVDIDKAYSDILSKSKRIRSYLQDKSLSLEFTEKMRVYKNFVSLLYIQRICFDNEIQKFIHRKELASDLRLIKKTVFNSLEEFIIQRFDLYLEEEHLHLEYKKKVDEI